MLCGMLRTMGMLVAALVGGAVVMVVADSGNFRTWDRDTEKPMPGATGNFRKWDARTDSLGGAVAGAVFVGTVESVDVSNRTVQVWGQESVVVRTGQTYDPKTRRVVVAAPNPNPIQTTNRVVRGLQTLATVEMRTFEVGGFCRIEPENKDGTKLIKRGSLADLQVGQMISVDFTRGVGERWTALGIVPFATLNVTNTPSLK